MAKQGPEKPLKAKQIGEAFKPVASLPPVNGDVYRIADVLDQRGGATVKRGRGFMESEIAPISEEGRDQFAFDIVRNSRDRHGTSTPRLRRRIRPSRVANPSFARSTCSAAAASCRHAGRFVADAKAKITGRIRCRRVD